MLSKNCNTCDWPSPYTNALLYCLSASAMLVGYQRLVAITQRRCLLCEDAPTGATGMNPDMACAWGWRYWSRAWGWCYWCRAWGWCYWCRAWGFFESERVSMNPFYISSVDIDDWFTCNDDDITYNLFNIECKTAEIKGISAIAWVSAMFRKQLQRRWQVSHGMRKVAQSSRYQSIMRSNACLVVLLWRRLWVARAVNLLDELWILDPVHRCRSEGVLMAWRLYDRDTSCRRGQFNEQNVYAYVLTNMHLRLLAWIRASISENVW